ncbi:MAG TPA: hypothetical protein VMH36_08710 [Alphaproteobacteria bacterium]|nr:hypothetical protein [Alphaproteobacteria bacterium]
MPQQRDLKPEEHVVRQCSRTRQARDEAGKVIGIVAEAFILREGESYLSAAWMEYFSGNRIAQLCGVRDILRSSGRDVKAKDVLAVISVGTATRIGLTFDRKLRFRLEPKRENPAYAAIRGTVNEMRDLLDLLAAEAVVTFAEVATLP